MATFNNLRDLERYVNRMAKEAMVNGNSVKETVIDEGEKQVQEVVYDRYPEPKRYQRTGKLKESWDWQESSDGIEIFNTRKDEETGKDIPTVIETGQGYDYSGYGYTYEKPRPFISETVKSLDGNKKLTESLKRDMRNMGIDVE